MMCAHNIAFAFMMWQTGKSDVCLRVHSSVRACITDHRHAAGLSVSAQNAATGSAEAAAAAAAVCSFPRSPMDQSTLALRSNPTLDKDRDRPLDGDKKLAIPSRVCLRHDLVGGAAGMTIP